MYKTINKKWLTNKLNLVRKFGWVKSVKHLCSQWARVNLNNWIHSGMEKTVLNLEGLKPVILL